MSDLAHPKLITIIIIAFSAVTAIWISTFLFRWRKITWRVNLETQIGPFPQDARDSGPGAIWKVFSQHEGVAQPSLVLLRIRNSGFRSIAPADMRKPLTFTFPGRLVKEFTVTDCRGVTRQMIQPPGDLSSPPIAGNQIVLPRFPMKRKAGFKLLVMLSGEGRGIDVRGQLHRGCVASEPRVRGTLARNIAFGSVLLLLVGIQAGITFSQAPALPSYCGTGRLLLEGSTAFAPTAREIGSAYTAVCHGAAVSVSAISTFNGLNAVATSDSGPAKAVTQETVTQIAMSDGLAPAGYPELVGLPVAVMLYAVVVNRQDIVYNLTTAQLRAIFRGTITNWEQVGGANLPIKIVTRVTGSGTRRAFDQEILGGAEPPFSSYNCISKNAVPSSRVIRCEVSDTTTLLQRVNAIPGAIGYAQISDAATYPDAQPIKINGWDPTIGAIKRGFYKFWTVEYLYTSGHPAPGSLAADFLGYLTSTTSDDILRSDDYTPCVDRGQTLMSTLCRP